MLQGLRAENFHSDTFVLAFDGIIIKCGRGIQYESGLELELPSAAQYQACSVPCGVGLPRRCFDDEYCYGIDTAVLFLQRFIKVNGLDAYKTGRNLALTEYFFRPFSGNGHKPFTYNFNDTGGEQDFTNQVVSKVMRTHAGQCRSLPMYYKVLAEALGAKAYIAYAPAHVFIRYRNEDNMYPEEWVNVELTTHQITPESFYKEHYEISDKAVANKVYLHPLTDQETVAGQLADLAFGYVKKFGLYDDFTRRCTEKSLEYYPHHPNAIIILGKSIEAVLAEHLKHNGYIEDEYARRFDERLLSLYERLKSLGGEVMSEGLYEKLEKGNEQGKRMRRQQQNKFNP